MDIRVHLDYGDIVYDRGEIDKVLKDGILLPVGISSTQLRNIESLQYEAARIVTGAWKSTSRDKLYGELGWESLQERRLMRRLSIIYETQDTKFPNYLHQILEKTIKSSVDRFGTLCRNAWRNCESKAIIFSFNNTGLEWVESGHKKNLNQKRHLKLL